MYKKILKKFLWYFIGNIRYQRFFELLHEFSLKGMYIGYGNAFTQSGEKNVLKYILKRFNINNDPIIVFDVGANDGEHANYLMTNFEHKFVIYSFEPSIDAFDKLKSNVGQYKNSKIFNFGMGDKNEILPLWSPTPGSYLASLLKLDFSVRYKDKKIVTSKNVEIKKLDTFCAENNINNIHFLKIDVEGYEMQVLQGAKRMIDSNSIYSIQFEFGGIANLNKCIFLKYFYDLLSDQYNLFRVVRNGLYPIRKYDLKLEQFDCTNFFAELKDQHKFNTSVYN